MLLPPPVNGGWRTLAQVVIFAVTRDGHALAYASARLRGSHPVVLAAVTQNGNALR